MMNIVIRWSGGSNLFENSWLGDRRVAAELDRLAAIGARGVSIEFPEALSPTFDREAAEKEREEA